MDLGLVRWAADGEAGIEFVRMSAEDACCLRMYADYVEKEETRSSAGREVEMWTTVAAIWRCVASAAEDRSSDVYDYSHPGAPSLVDCA